MKVIHKPSITQIRIIADDGTILKINKYSKNELIYEAFVHLITKLQELRKSEKHMYDVFTSYMQGED